MEMNNVISVNGKTIRLTDERWMHITLGHPELADYYYEILDCIENPDIVYEGDNDSLIGIKNIDKNKHIVVIYKETINDGFIITAYISNKIQKFIKKKILWEPKK